MRTILLVAFLCLILAPAGAAAILNVPNEYEDIASALDLAGPGDTIMLDSGRFSGPGFSDLQLEVPGTLTIAATYAPGQTLIDLQTAGFLSIGESLPDSTPATLVLDGLTFTNGYSVLEIGPLLTVSAVNCVFSDNTVAFRLGGAGASASLDSCFLTGNDYAIVMEDSATLIAEDVHFRSNYCAVWAYPGTFSDIRRCMFFYHDWTLVFEGASADISSSLLFLNFVGIKGSDTLETDINVSCSNVFSRFSHDYAATPSQTGQNGNVSLDPLFCDSTAETSLNVAGISPLLPENNDCGLPIGHVDVGCCCVGGLGNVNYDNQDDVDVADIQTLIDNLFLTLTPLACVEEGDLNFDHWIDITDLQILIDNQFLTLTPLGHCP